MILIFLLLVGCSYNNTNKNKFSDIDYSDDLTLEEFKIKLKEYSNNKEYPNIYLND